MTFVGHTPNLGDVGAVFGIVDFAIAGQLIGLLPVLAPTLPVALPGQAAITAIGFAGFAQTQARD